MIDCVLDYRVVFYQEVLGLKPHHTLLNPSQEVTVAQFFFQNVIEPLHVQHVPNFLEAHTIRSEVDI